MNTRIAIFAVLLSLFLPSLARADVYYVTVSGLAGDTDYQQRFTSSVNELDKGNATNFLAKNNTLSGVPVE